MEGVLDLRNGADSEKTPQIFDLRCYLSTWHDGMIISVASDTHVHVIKEVEIPRRGRDVHVHVHVEIIPTSRIIDTNSMFVVNTLYSWE